MPQPERWRIGVEVGCVGEAKLTAAREEAHSGNDRGTPKDEVCNCVAELQRAVALLRFAALAPADVLRRRQRASWRLMRLDAFGKAVSERELLHSEVQHQSAT